MCMHQLKPDQGAHHYVISFTS